jgi:hypothetical protein
MALGMQYAYPKKDNCGLLEKTGLFMDKKFLI